MEVYVSNHNTEARENPTREHFDYDNDLRNHPMGENDIVNGRRW